MKNLILFFILIAVLAVVSCNENDTVPEPAEPVSREDSIKITLLKPSPTKEPYILLEDAGLEAELIAEGLDTDNQINGMISAEDADKIEFLGRPISVNVANPEDSHFYTAAFYYRHHAVKPILKKEYEEKTGKELIVKKLSDVNAFKNLKKLYVVFPTETIDSLNLSANNRLEVFETYDTQIKVVDFNGCKEIKKISFTRSPHPVMNTNLLDKIHISQCSKLEYLSYNGDTRILDISQNTNLKYLQITNRGDLYQLEIEKLDLCNHPRLESLFVSVQHYKSINLSKGVYAIYENSKQQNTPNGFSILDVSTGGAEINVCR